MVQEVAKGRVEVSKWIGGGPSRVFGFPEPAHLVGEDSGTFSALMIYWTKIEEGRHDCIGMFRSVPLV